MMAPGMAHFHVGGTRASILIRIAAPGPAWEESMSPADFALLTHWLDSPCGVYRLKQWVGMAGVKPKLME